MYIPAVGSGLDFAQESLRQCWYEALPLIEQNAKESGALEFNPDPDRFFQLEDAKLITLYVARRQGEIRGYSIFFVNAHLHYDGIWALQDVLYVCPEERGRGAVRFMTWCDQMLKTACVDYVIRHVSEKVDYSRTLVRMGYAPLEKSFMRKL